MTEGPADPLIGSLVEGRYRIHAVLGRGGMGVVYDAVQVALDRPVALKVVRPELAADGAALQRLLREARVAGQLGGAHVAAIHDLGTLRDGRPYLVMDRLEGPNLAETLDQDGTMYPAEVVALLRGPAVALTEAHRRGIVHRDVKPENLVLVRDGAGDRLVLVDFGLAAFCEPGPARERLTRAGVVIGTPAYMAPECIEEEPPAPSCDVYGLAAVAFEMLTGWPPFETSNPIELMRLKCKYDPPSLSEVAGIPFAEGFELAIAHGLARRREERFETPTAFARALSEALRIVQNEASGPRRPTPAQSFDTSKRSGVRRNRAIETAETEAVPSLPIRRR